MSSVRAEPTPRVAPPLMAGQVARVGSVVIAARAIAHRRQSAPGGSVRCTRAGLTSDSAWMDTADWFESTPPRGHATAGVGSPSDARARPPTHGKLSTRTGPGGSSTAIRVLRIVSSWSAVVHAVRRGIPRRRRLSGTPAAPSARSGGGRSHPRNRRIPEAAMAGQTSREGKAGRAPRHLLLLRERRSSLAHHDLRQGRDSGPESGGKAHAQGGD